MCLYQRAAWGNFAASGAALKALKVTTSAWLGEELLSSQYVCTQLKHQQYFE
jgi:hypothetical protein